MTRKVFTPAAAMEAKRLYSLMDDRGNHVHSQMEIAAMLGVSETTVFRAVHKRGAYLALPEVKTDADAEESLRVFKEKYLEAPAPERKPPPMLLDGGDAPDETAGAGSVAIQERAKALGVDIDRLAKDKP